jgi:6-phosphogluconolactonase (cycloisomerase 2 family)
MHHPRKSGLTTFKSSTFAATSALLLATLATLAAATRPGAQASGGQLPPPTSSDPAPRGVVYVESNDPTGNAILAYKRADDGSLTPLKGSPFATGGLGVTPSNALGPFDSDQNLIANPDRTLLFAVNGGSDTIAVFSIKTDGSLTPVAGSPFPSGGSNPASVGLSGDILCVVNKDEDPNHPGLFLPNYTNFLVTPAGRLAPIPHSTFTDDLGSDPSQALISPSGNLVFGADFLGGILRSFAIDPTGQLEPKAEQGLPPAEFADTGKPPLPLGLAAHPTRSILYVGFVTINRVGVYRYAASGALSFVRSVPDSGSGVCWLRVNQAGTRLYASNTGDPSVSVFDLTVDPTSPIEIQKVNLNVIPGSNPGGFQFSLDPSERFLQVVTQQDSANSTVQANALHVLSIDDDGKLTEVPSSPTLLPVPNLTRPQGVLAF